MSTHRTRRLRFAAVAVVGALGLSACTFHPGQAAVVNGSSISQSSVDDLVLAACAYSKVLRVQQHGPAPTTSVAYLRNVFTDQFVSFKIADKAAAALGITITPSAIHTITASEPVPTTLGSTDRSHLIAYFTDSARAELQAAMIGAHLKHKTYSSYQISKLGQTAAQVYISAGQAYLATYTAAQDVSVNPAYGTWQQNKVVDTDGSLSSAVSFSARNWLSLRSQNANSVKGLPASQVCG